MTARRSTPGAGGLDFTGWSHGSNKLGTDTEKTMKISKDLSISKNEYGMIAIFSYSLGKSILVNSDEILPLINALQAELLPCGHSLDHESMLLETGEFVCEVCGAVHK